MNSGYPASPGRGSQGSYQAGQRRYRTDRATLSDVVEQTEQAQRARASAARQAHRRTQASLLDEVVRKTQSGSSVSLDDLVRATEQTSRNLERQIAAIPTTSGGGSGEQPPPRGPLATAKAAASAAAKLGFQFARRANPYLNAALTLAEIYQATAAAEQVPDPALGFVPLELEAKPGWQQCFGPCATTPNLFWLRLSLVCSGFCAVNQAMPSQPFHPLYSYPFKKDTDDGRLLWMARQHGNVVQRVDMYASWFGPNPSRPRPRLLPGHFAVPPPDRLPRVRQAASAEPSAATKTQTAGQPPGPPPPPPRPAYRNERERKKVLGLNPRSLLAKAMNMLTEGTDLLDCAYQALPAPRRSHPKKYHRLIANKPARSAQGSYRSPVQRERAGLALKAERVWRHYGEIDVIDFLSCVALEQAEDRAIAKFSKAATRSYGAATGRSVGIGVGPAI